MDLRAVVLVEGVSDRIAVRALAARLGRDLDAEGVSVVPMDGAHAIGRFLDRLGPRGERLRLAGLCDAGEESHFRQALERAGLGRALDRESMERIGFYVCEANLEDELIRALGSDAVVKLLGANGDLGSFRTFQKQPEWRGRSTEAQLRRYLHSSDQRNIRYPPLFIQALDLARVPHPLGRLLEYVLDR